MSLARADGRAVQVSELPTDRDLEAFISLPWRIYAGDPAWVPPLLLEGWALRPVKELYGSGRSATWPWACGSIPGTRHRRRDGAAHSGRRAGGGLRVARWAGRWTTTSRVYRAIERVGARWYKTYLIYEKALT